jgi:hypothetical protein
MGINRQLSDLLYDNGADLVGFADLSECRNSDFRYGISAAVRIPPDFVAPCSMREYGVF